MIITEINICKEKRDLLQSIQRPFMHCTQPALKQPSVYIASTSGFLHMQLVCQFATAPSVQRELLLARWYFSQELIISFGGSMTRKVERWQNHH